MTKKILSNFFRKKIFLVLKRLNRIKISNQSAFFLNKKKISNLFLGNPINDFLPLIVIRRKIVKRLETSEYTELNNWGATIKQFSEKYEHFISVPKSIFSLLNPPFRPIPSPMVSKQNLFYKKKSQKNQLKNSIPYVNQPRLFTLS